MTECGLKLGVLAHIAKVLKSSATSFPGRLFVNAVSSINSNVLSTAARSGEQLRTYHINDLYNFDK